MSNFPYASRIKISNNPFWKAKIIYGTISSAHPRMVNTVLGAKPYFDIRFDTPQIDSDGDGPYAGGEIDADYLELI